MSKETRQWNHCASCGDELDIGWERNGCGLDWMDWAYPWWRRLLDRIKNTVTGARVK